MIRLGYIGFDPQTLIVLSSSKDHCIVFVSKIDFPFSLNPFNLITRFLYSRNIRLNPLIVNFICRFLTYPYRRYSSYFRVIFSRRIKVLDIDSNSLPSTDVSILNTWFILSEEKINHAMKGVINIHPSKLPMYRGALPTLWALKNKDKRSAVTFALINSGIDSGDVLEQVEFDISEQDNALNLEDKISGIIERRLNGLIQDFMNGRCPAKEQSGMPSTTGKYDNYRKIEFEKEPFEDIFNKVTLYSCIDPGYFCFFYIESHKIHVKNIFLNKISHSGAPYRFSIRFQRLIPLVAINNGEKELSFRLFFDIGVLESLRVGFAAAIHFPSK